MTALEATLHRPVSLKLDQADHDRLKSLADLRQRKPHFLMKEAIRQYLDCEQARESFKHEALASWQEYQETGQHLTGQEVTTWLETWGTEQEGAMPACHD